MKLKTLSASQEERLKHIAKEYIDTALEYKPIDKKETRKFVDFIYGLMDLPAPEIVYCKSPMAAQIKANELAGTKNISYSFGTFSTIGWTSFYAYYDTFVEFGVITEEEFPKYFELRKLRKTNIFSTIEFDKAIIICEKPIKCHRNENGLHNTKDYAVEWTDGYGLHFINGRFIKEDVFRKASEGKLKKKEYLEETNDEVRSAWYEILGPEKLMELLNASVVDSVTLIHENGEDEQIHLIRTKDKCNKIKNEAYAWIKRVCPSTGSVYLTPTNPNNDSALEAAKFHRPDFVPSTIPYSWFSRS